MQMYARIMHICTSKCCDLAGKKENMSVGSIGMVVL
jgi:hypothetical protein